MPTSNSTRTDAGALGPSTVRVSSGGSAVIIRQFRKADAEDVRKLFWKCNTEGAGSPLQEALKSSLTDRTTVVPAFLSALSLSLAVMHPRYRVLAGVLSTACVALVLGARRFLEKSVEGFMEAAYKTDMADIEDHYGVLNPESRSNFWVAELVNNKGEKEIVGCVGLDSKNDTNHTLAEVKRMCVSPNHRRRGIGAKLVEALLAHARAHHFRTVTLLTSQVHAAAVSMYTKAGWVVRETNKVQLIPILMPAIEMSILDLYLDSEKEGSS